MVPRETASRPGKGPDGRARTREVKIATLFTQAHTIGNTDPIRVDCSSSFTATFDPVKGFTSQLKAEHRRRGFDQIRQPI